MMILEWKNKANALGLIKKNKRKKIISIMGILFSFLLETLVWVVLHVLFTAT